jgi:hypothetical protein
VNTIAQTDDGDGDGYVQGQTLPNGRTESDFGHVAWVTGINTDGTVTIEDYNWGGTGTWGRRVVAPSRYRYINIGLAPTQPTTQPPSAPTALTVSPHRSRVHLAWPAVADATDYIVTRGSTQFVTAGTSWLDVTVSPGQQYTYSVQARNGGGVSTSISRYVSTWDESANRAYVATKVGPALCGRAGDVSDQRLVCTVHKATGWVKVVSPSRGDWGYSPDRAWVTNPDGTVSYCARVGTGNQVRCDTFDGSGWSSSVSPVTDPGYPES